MSSRDFHSPTGETDVSDPKVSVDDECTDSGYISGIISETISGNLSENVQNLDSVSLEQSLARVNLNSDQAVQQEANVAISKDIPWQVLFSEDDDGDTQLHVAAARGCAESVACVLNACPARELLDLQNDCEQTALHLAAAAGHHHIVRALVQAGAGIECRDCMGETPLHIAATYGHKSCLQALLAPVPGKRPHVTSAVLNQKNYNGQTSLHCAALGGYIELVKMLVFYGADVNAREGLGGYTVLHLAAERGDMGLAAYLLDACPGAALGETTYAGKTARRLAEDSRVRQLFAGRPYRDDEDYCPSSDDDYDEDDDDTQSLFMRLREGLDRGIAVL